MKKNLLFIALTVTFLYSAGQDVKQKMNELVTAYASQKKFNGAVLVAVKGEVIFEKGFGFRNAEEKQANDQNSIFQIGSVTKQFTAAIIMQLQEEKKLSVQDKLSNYFPGFVNGDKITIEHLLTHTSGIYNYTNDTSIMNNDVTRHFSSSEMIERFKKYPPDFEPGAKWNYSNSGYSLLGYIIEKVTSKPYEKVVRERIFQPLGMVHSGFDFTHLKNNNKGHGYFSLAEESPVPAPIVDSTLAYAAGAIYTTVEDLFKWERAITAGKILKPESWKAVFTPYKNKYGYGWSIDTLMGRTVTAHGGGIHGFVSMLMRFPEDELVVILLDNSSSSNLGAIAKSLAAIAFDKPYSLPEAKKEIKLDLNIVQKYTGEYELAPNFIISVFLEDGHLKARATGQQPAELFAEKENLFFLKVVDASIEFTSNEKGDITGLVLVQGGRHTPAKKIK